METTSFSFRNEVVYHCTELRAILPLPPGFLKRNAVTLIMLVWSLFLAFWLSRAFFLHPAERFFFSHENFSYVGRLIEFRANLGAGYLFPQWCSDFQGGLGSPYFSYYHPGFFYVASLIPWGVPPMRALGIAIFAFALVGFWFMYSSIARRYGSFSGIVSGSAFLLSVYAATDVFVRGDLSEYSAMMTLPFAYWATLWWIDRPTFQRFLALSISCAVVVVLHAIIGVACFMMVGLLLLLSLLWHRNIRVTLGGFLAMGLSLLFAAFYVFPLLFEWQAVQTAPAFQGHYSFARHFVSLAQLFGPYTRTTAVPFTLGWIFLILPVYNIVSSIMYRRAMSSERWWILLSSLVGLAFFIFIISASSTVLWTHSETLRKFQFPWRFLTVITVFLAAMHGATLSWKHEGRRMLFVGIWLVGASVCSWWYTSYAIDWGATVPRSTQDLIARAYNPDPHPLFLSPGTTSPQEIGPVGPTAGQGIGMTSFHRSQGRFDMNIANVAVASFVTLPHYYFSLGWHAYLNDKEIPIEAEERGLMQIPLSAGSHGRLVVVFSYTPMRALGLCISGIMFLIVDIWLFWPLLSFSVRKAVRSRRSKTAAA